MEQIINYILVFLFLFSTGSMIGWTLELLFRRFFSKANPERRWINPGFLTGPYLPLYGFSLCILFALSLIPLPIENPVVQKICLFLIMAAVITLIEYFTGLIFIKGMKIKLWDYSACFGNIQGIICPLFSFFWYILSAIYYFVIHPHITEWVFWFTNHIAFSFVTGFFYGIFVIDLVYSFNLINKIKAFAVENQVIVRYENFKRHLHNFNEERKEKFHFLFSLRSDTATLTENLKKYLEKIRHTN